MWPAEWRVFMYGAGLPIEQTRSRTGDAILERGHLRNNVAREWVVVIA